MRTLTVLLLLTSSVSVHAEELSLAFTGDVMFGRYVKGGFRKIGDGEKRLFEKVAPLLKSDFTVVNLETPVMKKPKKKSPYGTRLRFVATPADVLLLKKEGVHGVTIANNHSFDMRWNGAKETPVVLKELGMTIVGESFLQEPYVRPTYVKRKGKTIAYIGVTSVRNGKQRRNAPELPFAKPKQLANYIKPAVTEAKTKADYTVVVVHWGAEYKNHPPREIRASARNLAKLDVDLVIGHHPHVIQGTERIGNTVIAYSLGNFLFDNTRVPLRFGGVMKWHVDSSGCNRRLSFWPTHYKRGQLWPRPAKNKTFKTIAKRMTKLSKRLKLKWTTNDDHLAYSYSTCVQATEVAQP